MRLLRDWRSCLDETDLEMAATTKFHAMRRWFVSGAVVRRTLWGLLASVSLGVWIYLMTERVRLFNEHNLSTSWAAEFPDTLPLPAITICNFNMLSASALSDSDKKLLKDVSFAFNNELGHLKANSSNNTGVKMAALTLFAKYYDIEQNLLSGKQFSINDFISEKGWALQNENFRCFFGSETCSIESFKVTQTRFGRCYTFNSDGSLEQRLPGRQSGLRIYLNVEEEDQYPFGILGEIQQMAGAKVIIHQSFEPPVLSTGLAAMPGFELSIPLKETVMTTVNKEPWNSCGEGPIGPYDQYSVPGCLALCQSEQHMNNAQCACRPWYLPNVTTENDEAKYPVCSVTQTIYCSNWALNEDDRKYCTKNCIEACATSRYDFDAAYSKLLGIPAPSNQVGLSGGKEYSRTYIEDNWLQISVYYPTFTRDVISAAIAFPVDGLLADFGNYMSMFIGFSVVTMFDLLEYPFLKIYRQCIRPGYRKAKAIKEKRKNRRKRDPIVTVSKAVDDEKRVKAWTKAALAGNRSSKQSEDTYKSFGFFKRSKPKIIHHMRDPARLRVYTTRPGAPDIDYTTGPYRKRAMTHSMAPVDREPPAINTPFQFLQRSFSIGRA